MTKDVKINGFSGERFEAVKTTFLENFKSGSEVGASFAATLNGKFVIDMWAGYANAAQTRPWEKDTLVNVYSITKIMTALCVHMLIDRGLLDVDAPVAKYWPEFAQAGKDDLPVRYLLSHTAGLPGFDETLTVEDLYDWDKIVNLLASQKPWWEPGKKSGYHSMTFGYLLGEVVRRITGKTLGTFFREEVALPINADFHIGLSKEHDSRVAELIPPDLNGFGKIDQESMFAKVLFNPPLRIVETKDREWRAAEIPASNGHGNARSIARVAAVLACGGELDNVRLLSLNTIEKAIKQQVRGIDAILLSPVCFGLGFGLSWRKRRIGPNPRTFYWGGFGGSLCVMDLDAKLSFAYAMNNLVVSLTGDERNENLIKAVYDSL